MARASQIDRGSDPISDSQWKPRSRWWKRPAVTLLFVFFGLATVLMACAVVHDQHVIASDASASCAWLKSECFAYMCPPERPWRWASFDSREPQPGSDAVRVLEGGRYEVPKFSEMQAANGEWTRRGCTIRLWREGFDVWHYVSIQIEGEAPRTFDIVDGPTGQESRFWLPVQLGSR